MTLYDAEYETEVKNIVSGGNGNNTLSGGSGDDKILGVAGHDSLFGGTVNDILIGGKGNDSFWGHTINDAFIYSGGNAGNDMFIYAKGDGKDVIYGFDNNDTLTLDNLDFTISYSKKNKAVTLKFDDGGSITLKDFTTTTFHINSDAYKISSSKFIKQK